jgi:hypothetical protein
MVVRHAPCQCEVFCALGCSDLLISAQMSHLASAIVTFFEPSVSNRGLVYEL